MKDIERPIYIFVFPMEEQARSLVGTEIFTSCLLFVVIVVIVVVILVLVVLFW